MSYRCSSDCTCTQWHSTWCGGRRNALTGNIWPWEGIKHAEGNKQDQKRRAEKLCSPHVTIYTICQTSWCYQCFTTNFVQLAITFCNFWCLILSLVAKLHATCILSPHNVVLSPSYMSHCRPALASSINRHGSSSGGNGTVKCMSNSSEEAGYSYVG